MIPDLADPLKLVGRTTSVVRDHPVTVIAPSSAMVTRQDSVALLKRACP